MIQESIEFLHEIYEDKAAAQRALNARRIIEFPRGEANGTSFRMNMDFGASFPALRRRR